MPAQTTDLALIRVKNRFVNKVNIDNRFSIDKSKEPIC